MDISTELQNWLVERDYAQKTWTDAADWKSAALKAIEDGQLSAEKLAELTTQKGNAGTTPSSLFGDVRVKGPGERYSAVKSPAKHARSGQPVRDERGREVLTTSELEFAKAGAFLKWRAAKDGQGAVLSEHERELVGEIFAKDLFAGRLGSEWKTGVAGASVKALLEDATSGGQELVPEWFDQMIVQFPLLHSELLPHVDLRDMPRGSSVEGASVGNPSVTWGVAEGTAISPFDTADLVAGIDTSVHPLSCAIEVGRDFLSDAAVDVGRVLVENVGQKMLAELDRVIVLGNGTTEPQGIFNASGITDIGNPAGGAGAAAQVDDYEALLFAVPKQYRVPSMRPVFIANDTTYSRARSIPVGEADARRIFGMDHESYSLLGRPFKVSNELANNQAMFACLARYRLYRRLGQQVRFTSEGKELATKNLTLLVVRGRFGGRLVDPSACSYSDSWQA